MYIFLFCLKCIKCTKHYKHDVLGPDVQDRAKEHLQIMSWIEWHFKYPVGKW